MLQCLGFTSSGNIRTDGIAAVRGSVQAAGRRCVTQQSVADAWMTGRIRTSSAPRRRPNSRPRRSSSLPAPPTRSRSSSGDLYAPYVLDSLSATTTTTSSGLCSVPHWRGWIIRVTTQCRGARVGPHGCSEQMEISEATRTGRIRTTVKLPLYPLTGDGSSRHHPWTLCRDYCCCRAELCEVCQGDGTNCSGRG